MQSLISLLWAEFEEKGLPQLTPRELACPDVEGKVTAVIGMRRAGKTYFLYQQIRRLREQGIPRSRILYLNFEDDRLLPVDQAKFAALLEAFYGLHPTNHDHDVFLFLDEVQNVDGWPVVLRRFLDTRRVKIFISGSSAKLLSREIATSLRGRSLACEVWPFSFQERLHFLGSELPATKQGPAARDRAQRKLLDYINAGGFPETIAMPERERRETLRNYVDVVILRDVIERHKITNVSLIRYLIRTLINTAGGQFTVHKLFNDLKSQGIRVGKNTLHDYLEYVEDAFLAFLVPIHSDSVRKRNVNPRKVYAVDPGLVKALSLRLEDAGHLFENLMYVDLRRRGCDVTYYKTRSGFEVDFIARYPDGSMQMYQASFDISDTATLRREERALEDAGRELGFEGKLITPLNYVEEFLLNEPG